MGRPLRIQFSGACYLVTLKSGSSKPLFLSNHDRRHFLTTLKDYKERFGLRVYAYMLTDSSVDLVLETSAANLASVMQGFNTRYTKYFNASHNTTGHVFASRYQAWVVDKENFLPALTRYVHLTCVRLDLSPKPWRYTWSSCAAYVLADHDEPMIDTRVVLRHFGSGRLVQSVRYMQFLKEGGDGDDGLPIVGGVAIGRPEFLETLTAHRAPVPAPRPDLAPAAHSILREIAQKSGVDAAKIAGRLQWREISKARHEAVRRIWRETGMTVSEIARFLGRTPSSISQILHK